jgi:formate dehydrogenase major subunit
MTAAIPAFRFSRASAQAECAAILALGVEFRRDTPLGPGRTIGDLLSSGIDAVFLAIGASRPGRSMVEVEQVHPDIIDAMDVLRSDVSPLGETIVAGEDALAVDAARSLVRRAPVRDAQNAVSVQLVLTSGRGEGAVTPAMLAACAGDGIRIHDQWRVRRVDVDAASGLLESVDIARPDGSAAHVLRCDRLVLAAPRVPDAKFLQSEIEILPSGFIAMDPMTLRTSMPNVWAGGACAFGHRSIAHAVADGKRAAGEIHAALMKMRATTMFASAWIEAAPNGNARSFSTQKRRALPLFDLPPSDPFASTTPRAAERVAAEALRCFDCARVPTVVGECSNCAKCVGVCPTGAVSLADSRLTIDNDLCHRCNACVETCPEHALTMLRAEWEEHLRFE